MQPLPMVHASCSLSDVELAAQLDRYRVVGSSGGVSITPRQVEVAVGTGVSDALVEELVATERGCCTFFDVNWDPARRHLVVGVGSAEHEPALAAVAGALRAG